MPDNRTQISKIAQIQTCRLPQIDIPPHDPFPIIHRKPHIQPGRLYLYPITRPPIRRRPLRAILIPLDPPLPPTIAIQRPPIRHKILPRPVLILHHPRRQRRPDLRPRQRPPLFRPSRPCQSHPDQNPFHRAPPCPCVQCSLCDPQPKSMKACVNDPPLFPP
jgi:hypothetical protein